MRSCASFLIPIGPVINKIKEWPALHILDQLVVGQKRSMILIGLASFSAITALEAKNKTTDKAVCERE